VKEMLCSCFLVVVVDISLTVSNVASKRTSLFSVI
jgi:hypothetical protein